MIRFALRWTSLAFACINFSSCLSMVLDRARLDADMPLAPPAMVPDSAKHGEIHVQMSLRASDGTFFANNNQTWTSSPLGLYGQAQFVATPNFRWLAGGGISSTGSVWTGPVVSYNRTSTRVDLDALVGITRAKRSLVGHLKDSEADYNEFKDTTKFVDKGTRWTPWTQFACRIRQPGSGLWGEFRVIPSFDWGTIESSTTGIQASMDIWTYTMALSAGWIQEFKNGTQLTIGPRAVFTENQSIPDIQLVASLQGRLFR